MTPQNFQQQQNQKIQNIYEERSRMENLYRQGLISEGEYREKLKRIQDRLNTTKEITSFSKPGFQIPAPQKINNGIYDYKKNPYLNRVVGSPDVYVKTKTGWSLANNNPNGYYKKQSEERSADRKEKLAPYGETLGKDYKYLYDDWQKPMYGNDGYGNKSITGYSTVPEKSYSNNKPTVQTPQFNF
mgnify:CR=1 FL=1